MNTAKRIFTLLVALVIAFTSAPLFGVEAVALHYVESMYTINFLAGSGIGGSETAGPYAIETSVRLPSAVACGFTKNNATFEGWEIGGHYYDYGDTYSFDKDDAIVRDDQYVIYATAIWSDSTSSGTSSSSSKYITGTYKAGDGEGRDVRVKYSEKATQEGYYIVEFPNCTFTYKDHKFAGWKVSGAGDTLYEAGDKVAVNDDFTATAQWKKSTTGVTVRDPNAPSESESESSSSQGTAGVTSRPASSAPASSKPASSAPASSKPASSKPASSNSSSSASESESSSESSSSVPEVPEVPDEPEVFDPISLAYNISGDVPVTGIEFLLKEDIGENPQLRVIALDSNSATDAATAEFIASGDALAAFELSLLADGLAYHGSSLGTVTYTLNGTQADAESRFDSYVLAMVHVSNIGDYEGEYYMTDGENTYLYTPETDFRSAVSNVTLKEKDGVNRLIIKDASGLYNFAYQATANVIVEVNLLNAASAASASIDVTGLSPVLLVQLEVGDGSSSSGFAIPFWVWIVVGVVVLLVVVLVVLYLINRKNEERRYEEMRRRNAHSSSSSITGFDDD